MNTSENLLVFSTQKVVSQKFVAENRWFQGLPKIRRKTNLVNQRLGGHRLQSFETDFGAPKWATKHHFKNWIVYTQAAQKWKANSHHFCKIDKTSIKNIPSSKICNANVRVIDSGGSCHSSWVSFFFNRTISSLHIAAMDTWVLIHPSSGGWTFLLPIYLVKVKKKLTH